MGVASTFLAPPVLPLLVLLLLEALALLEVFFLVGAIVIYSVVCRVAVLLVEESLGDVCVQANRCSSGAKRNDEKRGRSFCDDDIE